MASIDIIRKRGDTYPMSFVVKSEGVPLDITDSEFWLTVDPSKAPTDDTNNLFALEGQIMNPLGGLVTFAVSESEADHVGNYFYDLQMIDPAGIVRTIQAGKFNFVQDITKIAA